jgi:GTP-dependent dephospho-CoA kinase
LNWNGTRRKFVSNTTGREGMLRVGLPAIKAFRRCRNNNPGRVFRIMVQIPEEVKNQLKTPIGELFKDLKVLGVFLEGGKRIISVGDVCTATLLTLGIRPHLAVFDYHTRRADADKATLDILKKSFGSMMRYDNPAGTVSDILIKDAKTLMVKGGAILIDGEEDLTALAFIMEADEDDLVLYGQPGEGVVVVKPTKDIKRRIKGWLSR